MFGLSRDEKLVIDLEWPHEASSRCCKQGMVNCQLLASASHISNNITLAKQSQNLPVRWLGGTVGPVGSSTVQL